MKNSHTIIFMLALLFAGCEQRTTITEQAYPWQIKLTSQGNTRVFGIELEVMPLGHAARVLQKRYELGLFENQQGELSLEAFFSEITRGGLSGKIIVLLQAEQQQLQAFKLRSIKRKRQESGVIKHLLSASDARYAEQLIITGLSYIPYTNLEYEIIVKRFGKPDKLIASADGLNHYLYFKKGLDIIQDDEGKELLQYVSPANMSRLLKPLNNYKIQ
jgi:hypothetical protein